MKLKYWFSGASFRGMISFCLLMLDCGCLFSVIDFVVKFFLLVMPFSCRNGSAKLWRLLVSTSPPVVLLCLHPWINIKPGQVCFIWLSLQRVITNRIKFFARDHQNTA